MTDLPATCMGCFEGDMDPRAHLAGCPFLDRGTGVRWPDNDGRTDVPRTDHGWGCIIACLYDAGRPVEWSE
jgi:hypothetical protein